MANPALIPTEAEEARVFMQLCKLKGYLFTHIKNETMSRVQHGKIRNWKGFWDYQDGVRPGFPDFIVIANKRVFAVELKRRKGGRVSEHQQRWIDAFNAAGIPAAVCYGADEAISFVMGTSPTAAVQSGAGSKSVF